MAQSNTDQLHLIVLELVKSPVQNPFDIFIKICYFLGTREKKPEKGKSRKKRKEKKVPKKRIREERRERKKSKEKRYTKLT